MKELHDIRPPVMAGMDPSWIMAAWIAGAVILLILAVWIFRKKFRKHEKTAPEELSLGHPLQDPFASAISALDTLEEKASHTTDMKKLYFTLGDIMKTYIGTVHNTRAREMTTQELAASLKTLSMDRPLGIKVARFQEECDPFRYAPEHTDMAHKISTDMAQARRLIQAMEADRQSHAIENQTPVPAPLALTGEKS